ncbi:MAG: OmpA family protein [Chitinophagaceae bacterium]
MKQLLLAILLFSSICLAAQTIDKSYQNFDFVAGEKVLFEDKLTTPLTDKQNTHWLISGGAASIIDFDNQKSISINAYYTKLKPILFVNKALPDSFSIEYDTWLDQGYDGNPGIEIHLQKGETESIITPNKHDMTVSYPNSGAASKDNPEAYFGENKFYNRWVHISIAQYRKHLKVYLDQYPMIDIADCQLQPESILVTGNMSQEMKILFKNFRVATVFPTKLSLTNGKFITHAIKFDVDKYDLKPESITVLKQIYQYLSEHGSERFEIGGHTDSDGTPDHNTTLSQKRAEAVKSQLIAMGIAATRLETKGYGSSKPIDAKNTTEAKALNRRVEFTKL